MPVHGGPLRLVVGRIEVRDASVDALLAEEAAAGRREWPRTTPALPGDASYRARLLALLGTLKARPQEHRRLWRLGNGSTMLNYCGVDENYLDYIVDRNVQMQGCFMPGVHLPVLNPDRLVSNRPDYVLLLAWNSREEVLTQQEAYRRQGGRFIVPIPEPAII